MKVVVLLGLLIFNLQLFSQSVELFAKANQAYTEGKYDVAISSYHQILNNDEYSFELYYNLGNSYYKTNNIPKAILYYEKAKRLKSNDQDLVHNIEMANQKIVDQREELEDDLFSWFKVSEATFSISALLTLLLAVIGFVFFIWGNLLLLRKTGLFVGITFSVLFLLSSFLAFLSKNNQEKSLEGIIMKPVCHVKTEPKEDSNDAFILHEGSKVELLFEEMSWCKVQYSSNKIGWVEKIVLEKI